ncbi:MAG: PD-(D/E)XK nuclease family protein [Nitrososphaerales archaeon]
MADNLDKHVHDSETRQELEDEDAKQLQDWIKRLISNPTKLSSMVEHALYGALFSEWESESKNHHFKLGSYYPSIIERCVRQQVYSYLSPEVPTTEQLAIFSEGKAIHELIATTLRHAGLVSVEGKEIVVDLEFSGAKLHGRIDDLLLIRLSDHDNKHVTLYVPLEVKSTSSLPEEPKQAHYYQLSTYLLAKNFPFGVLLYWTKREGKIKAFTIQKEDVMYSVLRERVLEIHDSLKVGGLPRREAAINHEYQQCDRCAYLEKCNPFLIDDVPKGSKLAIFDIDSTILDTSPRRRKAMEELGLPTSLRVSDIENNEMKSKFWELYNNPEIVPLDAVNESGKQKAFEQVGLRRVLVGMAPGRKDTLAEVTKGTLANFGVPIFHMIMREHANYETDTKFKTRWILRLAKNYDVVEYFDRDATITTLITKTLEQYKLTLKREGQDSTSESV